MARYRLGTGSHQNSTVSPLNDNALARGSGPVRTGMKSVGWGGLDYVLALCMES